MKWKGMGEFKALHSLTEVARWNGGITRLTGAVLMGKSYEAALSALEYSDPRHPELRFDSIYPHIHFVPLDPFGRPVVASAHPPVLGGTAAGTCSLSPPPALTARA